MLTMWGNIDLEMEVDSRTTDIADLQRDKSKCVKSKGPDAAVDLFFSNWRVQKGKCNVKDFSFTVVCPNVKLLQDFIDFCLLILH